MAKTKRTRNRRRNLMPDEYKRRGHVAIEMDEMEAMLFAPDKVKEIKAHTPGYFLRRPQLGDRGDIHRHRAQA